MDSREMISPAQCRAARALLNWSQPELAEICGVHVQTVSTFESGAGSPTRTTLLKIHESLIKAGIDFLPNHGVAVATDKYFPSQKYGEVLDDVYNSLNNGDEVLFQHADDRESSPEVMNKLSKLAEKGIKMRATTTQRNDKRRSDRSYRVLPQEYFESCQLVVIYADKVAMHLDYQLENSRFLTIKNTNLSKIMRKQFEYWWKNGK
jgi:transcriptional regulator with XRE-family HTH domain